MVMMVTTPKLPRTNGQVTISLVPAAPVPTEPNVSHPSPFPLTAPLPLNPGPCRVRLNEAGNEPLTAP